MSNKFTRVLYHPWFIPCLLFLVTAAITAQGLLSKPKVFVPDGIAYPNYNNFLIFRQSFFHLISNRDLYQLFPSEHFDYYKYSPTFALFMAPLAFLPDSQGLFFWNALNTFVLFYALKCLPLRFTDRNFLLLFAFLLLELITSLQNSQSNALMAGLIILAFDKIEKKQMALGALLIVSTVFIKIFGLVALSIFIFYPEKIRSALYVLGAAVVLVLLPLVVVTPQQLVLLYQSWWQLLGNDHSASFGLSVMGWLHSWFGITEGKNVVVLLGVLLFLLPLSNIKNYTSLSFRFLFLASILIWMVIFNHKAESPTFIIAVTGIAIWYFTQKKKTIHLVLLLLALVLTVLSPTDLFPRAVRNAYIVPYTLKAFPCILIWLKLVFDMLKFKQAESLLPEVV